MQKIPRAARPAGSFGKDGVGDGTRTHDNRNHNPGLYQLSYTHHPEQQKSNGVGDGTRTHDNRNHNPGLYQLSYTHRSNFCSHITVRKEILRKPAVLSSSKNQFQAASFSREPAPALLTGLFTSLLRELLELRRSKPIVLEHRKHTSRGFDLARIQINHEQLLVNPALCDNHAHRIDHFRGSYGCRPAFAHANEIAGIFG